MRKLLLLMLLMSPTFAKDGVYSGTALKENNSVTVEVTVTDKKLVKITVTESNETDKYMKYIYKNLIKKMIKNNSTDIDGVSSATLQKGNTFINAVKNAVEKSGLTL